MSVTLSVEPLASTLLSSPLESFSPTFVTVTVPSWFTVNVMSVTLRYPVGAASSWNVYVPGAKSNSLVFPASDVQLCTGLPSAVSPLKILILASAISVPPKFTLLKVILRGRSSSLSVILSVEPLASTLLSSPLESFSPTFVTVTVPSLLTVKVISVTLRYPVGAASSWNVYVPGSKSNSLDFPASDVQLCTGLPSAVSPLKILILASAISVPPKFTLLKVIFFVLGGVFLFWTSRVTALSVPKSVGLILISVVNLSYPAGASISRIV